MADQVPGISDGELDPTFTQSAAVPDHSAALFERAERVTPGGVNSPVRSFGAVGGEPYFVESAKGAYVTDVDGNTYIDFVQSWGASILGHGHPKVVEAICLAAAKGTTYGAPTKGEVLLGEAITKAVPGCEQVRLVSSGTEAAMTAVRLARGATGRDLIVKFDGCYHGHSDALLAGGGSGVATLGLAGSAGVPSGAVQSTLVVPYNVVPRLSDDVACVIVEPVAANMGLVLPAPEFLQGLRTACDQVGALLIFDEVITGFRLGRSGASGFFGITPDLWCFGKVIGGGLPLAAIGGSRSLMGLLAPSGRIYQAGTLSGNPLATAAGLKVLELMTDDVYMELSQNVKTLANGLEEAFAANGIPVTLPRVETMLGTFFTDKPVVDYECAKNAAATGLYKIWFKEMLARKIAFAPSPYEMAFCSVSHGLPEIEKTIAAAHEVTAIMAKYL